MPTFLNEQQKKPVLNGRPAGNFGPPIGLFHPVFNSFQAAMRNSDRTHGDTETYQLVRELFRAAAGIYERKDERVKEIDEYLPRLLGTSFLPIRAFGVESDGVVFQAVGTCFAYLVIREVKNEMGTGSADPYNQACYAYRKFWAQSYSKSDFVPAAAWQ
jgi:hypothetical protein